ncbi:hypothetical protein KY335_05365 [Candidatus Woesearchaeota archaeon]|nr:hypothetical protein [Candidatus Woesearchaeota archaeon]MBW3014639.1 hypothetical protein [Candidatus Woesearchaeota archaeon]
MAKKQKVEASKEDKGPMPPGMPELTEEEKKRIEEKMKEIKGKVEKFQKKALEKFKDYILGVAVLPPEKKGQEEINVLVAIDDADSKRMTKTELREKLGAIMTEIGKADKIVPQVVLISELWQACFDGNYELLQTIAISAPTYDKGILGAVKISEVHKSLVLKKFDKYIVSYVAAGALFRGGGNEKSDIDVFIIIDDTDVKKMTRTELKDRLSAIIYQMAFEASAITGVKRQLHVQSYLLTDFWDILRDSASPVIFTFLRDGIPFYDRGIYMPWKHLLDMGRIRPSREAIRKFNDSGRHFFESAKKRLLSIGVEDLYYSVLNPAQAALMMAGFSPPTHRETGRLVQEIFVEKDKLLEKKYADILIKMIELFKSWEYGDIKELSGKEIDKLMTDCEDFRKRFDKLYKQIELQSDKETVITVYDQTAAAAREAIELAGGKKEVSDADLAKEFKKTLVDAGKFPETLFSKLETVVKAKKDLDANKITQSDIDKAHKESRLFIRAMIDFLTRSKTMEMERRTFRVKHKKGTSEVILLEKGIFILEGDKIEKAALKEDGSLGPVKPSNKKEVEAAVAESKSVKHLSSKTLEALREHLGGELELLV